MTLNGVLIAFNILAGLASIVSCVIGVRQVRMMGDGQGWRELWKSRWFRGPSIILFISLAFLLNTFVAPQLQIVSSSPNVVDINSFFYPSGIMGDIGDVQIGNPIFTYTPQGRGPHQSDFTYDDDGRISPLPAKFGGVCWLRPANNFGTDPNGGKDLRGYKKVHWEARSLGEPVNVEFFIGGVTWIWGTKDGKPAKIPAPYPDMQKLGFGTHELTSEWQEFDESLSGVPQEEMKRVVCAFGWVANWGSNGIEPNEDGTAPLEVKSFKFEIRNIRYEKGD